MRTLMLWSFCALLTCQTLGEILHTVIGLPIPGTVFGIALLLGGFCLARQATSHSLPAADALLPYLGLFFVPPGVSAVLRLGSIHHVWLQIGVAIFGSSALTLVVAGRVAQALLMRHSQHAARGGTPYNGQNSTPPLSTKDSHGAGDVNTALSGSAQLASDG